MSSPAKDGWLKAFYEAAGWDLPTLENQTAELSANLRGVAVPPDALPTEVTQIEAFRKEGLSRLSGSPTPGKIEEARGSLRQMRLHVFKAEEMARLRLRKRKQPIVAALQSKETAVPDDAPAPDFVRLNERRAEIEKLLQVPLTGTNLDQAEIALHALKTDLRELGETTKALQEDLADVGDQRKVEELLHKFGAASLKKLVADLGGPKAAAALAKEFKPDEIEGFLDAFEGSGKQVKEFVEQACGGEVADLRKLKSIFPSTKEMAKFAADTCGGRPQILGQMLKTGCGGDEKKLGGVLAAFKDDFAPLKNLVGGAGLAERVEDPPKSGQMRDVLPPDCLGQLLKAGGDKPEALAQLCGAFPGPEDAGRLKRLLVDGGLGGKPKALEGVLAVGFDAGTDMKAAAAKLKALADDAAADGYAGKLKGLLGAEGGLGEQPQVLGQLIAAGCAGDPALLKGVVNGLDEAGAAGLNALVKEGGFTPPAVGDGQQPAPNAVKADCLAQVLKVGCGGAPEQFNGFCKAFGDEASRKNLNVLLTEGGFGGRPACLGQVLATGFDGAISGEAAGGKLKALAADVATKSELKERLGILLSAKAKNGLGDQPEVFAHLIGTGCDKDPARVTALFTELDRDGLNGLNKLVMGGVLARKTQGDSGAVVIHVASSDVSADCLGQVLKDGCGGETGQFNAFCKSFAGEDATARKSLTALMTKAGLATQPKVLAQLVRASGPGEFAKVGNAFTDDTQRENLKNLVSDCGFADKPAALGQILATGFGGAGDASAGTGKLQEFAAQVKGDPQYTARLKKLVTADGGLGSQPEVFGTLLGTGCEGKPDKVKDLLTGLDDNAADRLNLLTKGNVFTPKEPSVKADCLAQVFKVGCDGKPEGFKDFVNGFAGEQSRANLGALLAEGGLGAAPQALGELVKGLGTKTGEFSKVSDAYTTAESRENLKKLLTDGGFGDKPACLGQALGTGFGAAFDATAAQSAAESRARAAGAEPAVAEAAAKAAAAEAGKGSDKDTVKAAAKAAAKAKALTGGAKDGEAEAAAEIAAEAAAKAAIPDPAAAAGKLQALAAGVLSEPELTSRVKGLLTAKDGLGDRPEVFAQLLGTGCAGDPATVNGLVQKLGDDGATSLTALFQEAGFGDKTAVKADALGQVMKAGCAWQPDQFTDFCKGYTSKDSRETLGKMLTAGGLGAKPEALGQLVGGLGGRPGEFGKVSDAYTTPESRENLKKLLTDGGFGDKPACLGQALGTGFGAAYNPAAARASAQAAAGTAAKNKAQQVLAAVPTVPPVDLEAKRSATAALGAAPAMAEAAAGAATLARVADVDQARTKALATGASPAVAQAVAAAAAEAVAEAAGKPVNLKAVKKAAETVAEATAKSQAVEASVATTAAKAAAEAIAPLVPSVAPPDLTEFTAKAKAAAKKAALDKGLEEAAAEATAKAAAEAAARAIVADPAAVKVRAKAKAKAAGASEDVAEKAAEAAAAAVPRTVPPDEDDVKDAAKAAAKAKALAAGATDADAEAVAKEAAAAAVAAVKPDAAGAAVKLQTFAADLAASGSLTAQLKTLLSAADGVGDQPEVFGQLLGTGCGQDTAQVQALLTELQTDGGAGATNLNALVKEGGFGRKTKKDAEGLETQVVKADCLAQVLKVGCEGKPDQFAAFCKGYDSQGKRETLGKLLTEGGLGAEPQVLGHLVTGVGEYADNFVKVSDAYDTEDKREKLKTLVTEAGFADKPACLGQALGTGFGASHNEVAARSAARKGVTAQLADPALVVTARTAANDPNAYGNQVPLAPIITKTITDTLADPSIAEAAAKAAAEAVKAALDAQRATGADPVAAVQAAAKAAAWTAAQDVALKKAKAATALAPSNWVVALGGGPGQTRTQNMADGVAEAIATAAAQAAAAAVLKKPEDGAASLQTFTADVLADANLTKGVRTLLQAEGGLGDQPEVFGHLLGTGCRRDAAQAKTLLTTLQAGPEVASLTALVKSGGFAKAGTDADPVVKPQCLGEVLAIGCGGDATKFKDLANGLADNHRANLQGMMRGGGLGKEPEVLGHLYKTGCQQRVAELKSVGSQFTTEADQQKLGALLEQGGLAGYNPTNANEQRPETLGEILNEGFRNANTGMSQPIKLKNLYTAFYVAPPRSVVGTAPDLSTLNDTVSAFNFEGKDQGIAGKPGKRVKNLMRLFGGDVGRLKTTFFDALDQQDAHVAGQWFNPANFPPGQSGGSHAAALSKKELLANAATFEARALGGVAQPTRPPRHADVSHASVDHTSTRHTRKHQTFRNRDLRDTDPKDTTMLPDDTDGAAVKRIYEQSYPLVTNKQMTGKRSDNSTATKAVGNEVTIAWMSQLRVNQRWRTTEVTLPDGTTVKTGFLYQTGPPQITNDQLYPRPDATKTTINHTDMKAIHKALGNPLPT
jgi:hypothetical protein